MSNDDHTIRIRLDISIPRDGKSIQVDTAAAPNAQVANFSRPPKLTILGVVFPAANKPHPVTTTGGSGNGGVIYSEGNCTGITPTPDEVILQCNSGTAVAAILDSSGNWYHNEVPGATCSSDSSSLPYNELHVLYKHNGSIIRATDVPFYGLCSSSAGFVADQLAITNRFLPTNYLVTVDGFSQSLSHFNGKWPMRLLPCGVGDAEVRWQCQLPNTSGSVELVGKPGCRCASLIFRDGVNEIRYEKPKGSWHPMNVADFANCSSVVVPPGASVPAIVQVELP